MSLKLCLCLAVAVLAASANAQSSLSVTATNQLNFVYVDGVLQEPINNGGDWLEIDTMPVDNYARVVAIRANNVLGGCSGIMAAIRQSPFDYVFETNMQWRCHASAAAGWEKPGFDDSTWEMATQVAFNGQIIAGCPWIPLSSMPSTAYWIWTDDWRDGDMVVSCRGYTPICDQNPCQNGATCDPNGLVLCNCPPHFDGQFCEHEIDVCESNPCQNGGICNISPEGYECDCGVGFTGLHCETDITDCASEPCQNGGTCNFIVDGGYSCSCPEGFSGQDCENDIDECASDPCLNGATCVDQANDVTCECVPGYTGAFCQNDINECFSNPCQHLGTCHDEVDGYMCECQVGYTGANCETAIGLCDPNPCQNGGTCTLETPDGPVRCECHPGYAGQFCQDNTNECSSNPCLHDGTCVDGDGFFTCECTEMYDGPRCDIIKPNCGSIMSQSIYPPTRNFWAMCQINVIDHANYVNTPCRDLIQGITFYNDSSTIIAMGGTFGCYPTKFPDEMPSGACVPNYNNDRVLSSCLSCTHMGVCIDVPPPPE